MRLAGLKEFTMLEWIILFAVMAAAVMATERLGLSRQWKDAVIYTVVVFTVVLVALRPAWGRSAFWQTLASVFAVHVVAVFIIIQAFPAAARGFPGLFLIIAGMAESVALGGVLWKRAVQSKSDRRG